MTREEAIEYLKHTDTTVGKKIKTRTAEALEMAISALSAEHTAEWIDDDEHLSENTNCSSCHFSMLKEFKKICNYCPNCGAKMK